MGRYTDRSVYKNEVREWDCLLMRWSCFFVVSFMSYGTMDRDERNRKLKLVVACLFKKYKDLRCIQ